MMKKTIRALAAGLALLFLLAGLSRALLSPNTEIAYENRPANRFPAFDAASFLQGGFQDAAECALADQIPKASHMKKLYNIFDTGLALPVIRALGQSGGYVGFRDICFFRDMLTIRPFSLEKYGSPLRQSARRISDWAASSPDVDFYVYYIESDRDLDLETGEKTGLYDCLAGELALPEGHAARLRVDSFEDYRRLFFRTDHHWKGEGARQGYEEICALLGVEPLPLLGWHSVPHCYRGTRAAGVEGVAAEDFAVSLFDAPPMRCSVPAGPIPDYGQQAQFAAGELEHVSYGAVFGGDYGELVFDTGEPGRTLLVMGDSYDNAIVKPLAALFSECRCVDLRAYEGETGRPFDMAQYLREYDVDCVLFVGAIEYFGGTLAQEEGGV